MDARERVLTALRGGEPDRVPFALGFFAQALYGAEDADEYFGTDVRFVDFAPPAGQDTFLEYLESLPPGVHVGSAAQLRTYHEWDYHPERAGRPALRRTAVRPRSSPTRHRRPHRPAAPEVDRPAAPRPSQGRGRAGCTLGASPSPGPRLTWAESCSRARGGCAASNPS